MLIEQRVDPREIIRPFSANLIFRYDEAILVDDLFLFAMTRKRASEILLHVGVPRSWPVTLERDLVRGALPSGVDTSREGGTTKTRTKRVNDTDRNVVYAGTTYKLTYLGGDTGEARVKVKSVHPIQVTKLTKKVLDSVEEILGMRDGEPFEALDRTMRRRPEGGGPLMRAD